MIQASLVGTLTIANGGTTSNVLTSPTLRHAVRLLFYTTAAFTGTVTVKAGFASAGTAPTDLYVNGVKAQIFGTGTTVVEGGGFNNVGIVSDGAEGAARTVLVYACLSMGA